ncbi:MAG: dephospho-CoA kinase [Thiohalocapsa sp.]|jgi:dephospho-CoA kinase|uniref:dephospho-CoA kinase n=1 Tax=Thiohalocapsa sp. TaxID=2497641 RepID=UPI0026014718|nr:dephospho-CoA kinase [Thiohalocapsa sp.]
MSTETDHRVEHPDHPFAVALTGGIGSGKSAVAALFVKLGVTVIDADVISHALTAPGGSALAPIADAFGTDVIAADGALDRAALREQVFSDPAARQRLEGILHPMIRARMQADLAAAAGPYAVLAIPLLVETGQTDMADRVLVVDAPEDLCIERVGRRSGLTPEQVKRIMASQASREDRLAAADDVIENTRDLEDLEPKVRALHARYLSLAAGA